MCRSGDSGVYRSGSVVHVQRCTCERVRDVSVGVLSVCSSLLCYGCECMRRFAVAWLSRGSLSSRGGCGAFGLRVLVACCVFAALSGCARFGRRRACSLRGGRLGTARPIGACCSASRMGWPSGLGPCVRGRCKERRSVMPSRRRGSGPGGAITGWRDKWPQLVHPI